MLVAWDVSDHSPRFFSKWSCSNLKNTYINHDMTVAEQTIASAATPTFFLPYTF
jgi:hypothetical protein